MEWTSIGRAHSVLKGVHVRVGKKKPYQLITDNMEFLD